MGHTCMHTNKHLQLAINIAAQRTFIITRAASYVRSLADRQKQRKCRAGGECNDRSGKKP